MAYDQVFPTDSTSKMIEVMVRDSTTGMGKTGLAYGSVTHCFWREGASSGTNATCVDAALGTWTTKGWKEVDATNQKGVYQFGVPNAALAAGTGAVTINFQASGMIDKSVRILLSSPTRGLAGPTALPDAAAAASGGLIINGSNAGNVEVDALTITGALTNGSTALGNTTAGTIAATSITLSGTLQAATIASTGATTFNSLVVTTTSTFTGTTTYTGAVAYTSTETHTGAVVHNGGTTFTNTGGEGFTITAGAAAAAGMSVTGNTTGPGLFVAGGSHASGIKATSGDGSAESGIEAIGIGTNGRGITASGVLAGIYGTASAGTGMTLLGVDAPGLLTTGGDTYAGIRAIGGATSGSGLYVEGTGTGSGILAICTGTGNGIYAIGDAEGHGIVGIGGDTAGAGVTGGLVLASNASANPIGLLITHGANIYNDHGVGVRIAGYTDFDALQIEGSGTGNAIQLSAGGTGDGFKADSVIISGLTTHTGNVLHSGTTTYTGAIVITDQTTSLSLGKYLKDILDDTAILPGTWVVPGVGTSTLTTTDVQTYCDAAITANTLIKDIPSNSEMTAAFTEIKGATWASTDTLEAIHDDLATVDGVADGIDTLLDKMATILIGTVTGAGTVTEVFVYDTVTCTVTVDGSGNRSVVAFT